MSTAQVSWLQLGAEVVATANVSWLQIDGSPASSVPAAPSAVAGEATGGATASLSLTDNTAGVASHRWQIRPAAGTWADAIGATNPSAAGIATFSVTGLDPVTEYEIRARSETVGGNSAYVAGANFWTDNPASGGGSIPGNVVVNANAPGASLAATVTLVAGGAAGQINASAPGASLSAVATLVAGGAAGQVISSTPAVPATTVLAIWPPKDPRESFAVSFTFPGPVSDVVMNVDVYSQYGESDPTPESIFDGSFVVADNVVIQRIRRDAGVPLVDYYIDCVATSGSERLVASGMLPVRIK